MTIASSIRAFWIVILPVTGFGQGLQLEAITEVKPLKRGKEYNIKWTGGAKSEVTKITLTNAKGVAQTWSNLPNDGEEVISLSPKLRPGKGYNLSVSVDGEKVYSQPLQVKRRVPLAITIATFVVVPSVIILLSQSEQSPEHIPDPVNDPPNPSGN